MPSVGEQGINGVGFAPSLNYVCHSDLAISREKVVEDHITEVAHSILATVAPKVPKAANPKVCLPLQEKAPQIPPFCRLQQKLKWWREMASAEVLQLIQQGVGLEWIHP